jgi:hypothetical protein
MPLLNEKYLGFDEEDVILIKKMIAKFHELHRGSGMPEYSPHYVGYLPVFAIALLASQVAIDRLTKKLICLTRVMVLFTFVLAVLIFVLVIKNL